MSYSFALWLIFLPVTSILDSLLLWEESKQLHNCLVIGYRLAAAASGFGTRSMQGNLFLLHILDVIQNIEVIYLYHQKIVRIVKEVNFFKIGILWYNRSQKINIKMLIIWIPNTTFIFGR